MDIVSYTPNMFIPGTYTPGTMPDPVANPRMFAFDTTFGCWMESDGTIWRPSKSKLIETFNGTTDASGNVTFTYAYTYTALPNLQPLIVNQTSINQAIRLTSQSLTASTWKVEEQAAVSVPLISLTVRLGVSTNVSGSQVTLLVVER